MKVRCRLTGEREVEDWRRSTHTFFKTPGREGREREKTLCGGVLSERKGDFRKNKGKGDNVPSLNFQHYEFSLAPGCVLSTLHPLGGIEASQDSNGMGLLPHSRDEDPGLERLCDYT